jgi:hypothetical protein
MPNAGLFAQGISETSTPDQVLEMFDVNVFDSQGDCASHAIKFRTGRQFFSFFIKRSCT